MHAQGMEGGLLSVVTLLVLNREKTRPAQQTCGLALEEVGCLGFALLSEWPCGSSGLTFFDNHAPHILDYFLMSVASFAKSCFGEQA